MGRFALQVFIATALIGMGWIGGRAQAPSGVLGAASPQTLPTAASLVHIEGQVYVDDQIVPALPSAMTLGVNAVVRTDASRAAVSLKRGGTLLLSNHSSVRVIANGIYNFNRLEVLSGSAVVISAESSPIVLCQSEARLSSAGVFRFDVQAVDRSGQIHCMFRVYEGASAVPATSVINALRPGQAIALPAGDMVPVQEFSPTALDDFDRWSRQHAVKGPR